VIDPAPVAPGEAGSRVVFTLAVEDVAQMCADLRARGVELLNGPMDRPWGVRTASIRDPDGYIWEIAHKITSD
jgi:lactoylglutathione lyase